MRRKRKFRLRKGNTERGVGMNNAQQKGRYLETCLHNEKGFVELTFFPNNKKKSFVENMKRIAKEFHLEIFWKKGKDEVLLL